MTMLISTRKMNKQEKTVSWFSAGVSSAVATKLAINEIDQIIYIDIEDQHPDSLRFVKDCEVWFGKPILILQSPYKNVANALLGSGGKGYVNGPAGAPCTRFLKKRVRKEWELTQNAHLVYVWGMDSVEVVRAYRLRAAMLDYDHIFPLMEHKIFKQKAHEMLNASGVKRPAMYDMGYSNNNCIGCVKGGMGYWNKIRIDFPNVFRSRAELERRIGGTCIKGIYLDELDPNRGRGLEPVCEDCGISCEILAIK